MQYITNTRSGDYIPLLYNFTQSSADSVNKIHNLIPGFYETPLIELHNLAENLNVSRIFVKDESYRLGLNAFKVLGAGYAAVKYLSETFGLDLETVTLDEIKSFASDKDITLITATDGNHGKAVAFIANALGMNSIIYMPKGSSQERFDAIAAYGADVSITDVNYDRAVMMAKALAEEKGYIFIQDTAMEGYTDIPLYIMQGYMNLMREAKIQLGEVTPTHVFLQAGVGSFASSVLAYMVNVYDNYPKTVILEPKNANCVYMSAKTKSNYAVTGDLETIMAGLSCGVASTLALEVLLNYADMYVSLEDNFAEEGMRILHYPVGNDTQITSGESGAVGMGFLYEITTNPEYAEVKENLAIDENSIILIISTEGDTDKENYNKIISKGKVL